MVASKLAKFLMKNRKRKKAQESKKRSAINKSGAPSLNLPDRKPEPKAKPIKEAQAKTDKALTERRLRTEDRAKPYPKVTKKHNLINLKITPKDKRTKPLMAQEERLAESKTLIQHGEKPLNAPTVKKTTAYKRQQSRLASGKEKAAVETKEKALVEKNRMKKRVTMDDEDDMFAEKMTPEGKAFKSKEIRLRDERAKKQEKKRQERSFLNTSTVRLSNDW